MTEEYEMAKKKICCVMKSTYNLFFVFLDSCVFSARTQYTYTDTFMHNFSIFLPQENLYSKNSSKEISQNKSTYICNPYRNKYLDLFLYFC